MNDFPLDLAGAGGLLLANRLMTRPLLLRDPLYYPLQAVNLAGVVWFLAYGVRGLAHVPATGWAIAGLFAMHLVINASQRARAQHDAEKRRG